MIKKICILTLVALLACLTGCAQKSTVTPASTDEKVVKEIVVYFTDDNKLLVPSDELVNLEDVKFVLEDGSEVKVELPDLEVGEKEAEVVYVKDGNEVSETISVVIDTDDNIKKVLSSEELSPSEQGGNDDSANKNEQLSTYEALINGVVYGLDDIGNMDWDTSVAYADAVFGGHGVVPGMEGSLVSVTVTGDMSCDTLLKLAWGRRGKTGYITYLTPDNADLEKLVSGCGLNP